MLWRQRGVEIYRCPFFLTLALVWDAWSTSRLSRFNPGKLPGTRCTGDWVGLGSVWAGAESSATLRFDFRTVYLIAIFLIETLLSEEG